VMDLTMFHLSLYSHQNLRYLHLKFRLKNMQFKKIKNLLLSESLSQFSCQKCVHLVEAHIQNTSELKKQANDCNSCKKMDYLFDFNYENDKLLLNK
jgi:DNA-binding transcriptional MerR regulator